MNSLNMDTSVFACLPSMPESIKSLTVLSVSMYIIALSPFLITFTYIFYKYKGVNTADNKDHTSNQLFS